MDGVTFTFLNARFASSSFASSESSFFFFANVAATKLFASNFPQMRAATSTSNSSRYGNMNSSSLALFVDENAFPFHSFSLSVLWSRSVKNLFRLAVLAHGLPCPPDAAFNVGRSHLED